MIGLLSLLLALQFVQLQSQIIIVKYTATQPMNVTVIVDSVNAVTNVTKASKFLNTGEILTLPIEVKYLPGGKVTVKLYSNGNLVYEKTFTFTGKCVQAEISEHSLSELYPSSFNSGDAVVLSLKNVCPKEVMVDVKYNLPFKFAIINNCVRVAEVATTAKTVPPIYFLPLKVIESKDGYQLACIYVNSITIPNNVTSLKPLSSDSVVIPIKKPAFTFSLTPSLSAEVRIGSVNVNGIDYPVSVSTLNLAPVALLLVLAVVLIILFHI